MLSLPAKLTFHSGGGSTPSRTLMIKRRKKRTFVATPRRRWSPSRRSRQTRGSESENKAASSVGSPSVVVVMGVSGCGKTTIVSMLAHRLNWIFEEGDWFHPPSNVEKMHSGVPLTDEDRWPWLHGIAAWIDATRRVGNHGTTACSALKRAHRDVLVGERPDVRLVYLKGERDLIARRLAARDGHFMPPAVLDSQFATLEEPQADERPIVVSIVPHPREIVAEIVKRLGKGVASPSRGVATAR